jgi:hypothetical protein
MITAKTWIIAVLVMVACNMATALQVTEVMYNPNGTDTGREWVEIYADIAFNTTGLIFSDNQGNHNLNRVQGDEILNGYAIIASDAPTFIAEYAYSGTVFQASYSLTNIGETLGLKKGNLTYDNITYTNTNGGDGNGNSIEREGDGWKESTANGGTPGYQEETPKVPEFTAVGAILGIIFCLGIFMHLRKN